MNKLCLALITIMLFSGCSEADYSFEFTELNTRSGSSFRAICAVNENIVWASGSQGQVLLTLDGGSTWKQMTVPDCKETEFRSLHAWDARRALVFDVSSLGRAFMTSDGGLSWELVYQSPVEGVFFNSLKFANELLGITISDPVDDKVLVLKTDDGGENWKRLGSTPDAVEGEINFAASNTCIEYLESGEIHIVTGGSKSRVLSSHDHGNSWEFIPTPTMTGVSAGLFSINFPNASTGIAVGGDFNEPDRDGIRAIYTLDGGRHWESSESMPVAYRSCVVSLRDDLLFAIGKTGCDYSTDMGKNWTFIDSTGYYAANAVEGRNILYLAGSEGRIARVDFTALRKNKRP